MVVQTVLLLALGDALIERYFWHTFFLLLARDQRPETSFNPKWRCLDKIFFVLSSVDVVLFSVPR